MLLFPQCLGICTDLKYHPPGAFFQADLTYLLFGSSLSTSRLGISFFHLVASLHSKTLPKLLQNHHSPEQLHCLPKKQRYIAMVHRQMYHVF